MTDPHSPTFDSSRPRPARPAGHSRRRLHALHPDPGPDAARSRSPAGMSPDRRRPAPARPPRSWSRCIKRCSRSPAPASRDADLGPRAHRGARRASSRCRSITTPRSLGRHTGLAHAVVYGGIDYEKQRRQLAEGIDVLIGTPGRLIDYFKQHVFDLQARAGAGAGRGRPHVRSRLHRRHPLHPAAPAAAGAAAVDAVLRDALPPGAGARLRAHEQPGAGAHRAGQDDGRSRAADHVLPLDGGESSAARSGCCARARPGAR